MQLQVPADLEALINKRLATGGYDSPEDVLRDALHAQDASESFSEEERQAWAARIEEGYQQAQRGDLIDGEQAKREIAAMKDEWRAARR